MDSLPGGEVRLHPVVRDMGIAYVAQEAWIQNGTIKDNILCGMPPDDDFYKKVRRWGKEICGEVDRH